jgi:hypothetical protein
MSYDLYLWHSPRPVTVQQAMTIMVRLAEGRDDVVVPDDAVLAFHQDLIELFPPLDAIGDEEIDDSPWNASPDATASRAILCFGYSQVPQFAPAVVELAAKHGLVCFDPQSRAIHHQPVTRAAGSLLLESGDGSVVVDPGAEELRSQLEYLSETNFCVFLEREEGWFVQVGIGESAGGVPDGKFALEYREGVDEPLYRVLVDGFDDVVGLFEDFAAGRDSFKAAFAWAEYA